ncbi:unnamed protein product [Calypogeia fissa]
MLAMRLQTSVIVMAPYQHLQQRQQQQRQRRRHPVGVLHAVLLLLCLALLMRASAMSAYARHVPSENDNGYVSNTARQQVSPTDRSVLPSNPDEDNLKDCTVLPDSTSEPCVSTVVGRMLVDDYGPPGGNQDSRPAGPIP